MKIISIFFRFSCASHTIQTLCVETNGYALEAKEREMSSVCMEKQKLLSYYATMLVARLFNAQSN